MVIDIEVTDEEGQVLTDVARNLRKTPSEVVLMNLRSSIRDYQKLRAHPEPQRYSPLIVEPAGRGGKVHPRRPSL